jgi:hypothetical protein
MIANKPVIIIGGGASITDGIELGLWNKIQNYDVWSINYAYMFMPYLPSREVWIDVCFFRNNIDSLQQLYNKGVPCYAKSHTKYVGIPEIQTYDCTRDPNDTKDKVFIGRMGLGGFFALHLTIIENYNPIFILGYDFGGYKGKTHFYQDVAKVESVGINHPELYVENNKAKAEVEDFEWFLSYPNKIYNVSLSSNINYFDKISYEIMFNLLTKEKENEN